MKVRLKWHFGPQHGAVSHSGTPLLLLCEGEVLDPVSHLPVGRNGIRIGVADDQGRYRLVAVGDVVFLGGDKEYRSALLPAGGKANFRCGETEGSLNGPAGAIAQDPLVGTTLGGYKILNRLGAGAVGVVYRSLQTSLDSEIALKVLSPQAAKSAQAVRSFVKEAQAAGRLSHPNLVQVHDVGQSEGNHYYAMELVPGGNLEEALAEQGPLPWRKAVAYARDCAKALAFAEENGLVHRDVKPENLMLAQSGIVKLADLGLAATREMLDVEAAGGTPHFMAPETAGGKNVDARSDLYSLGCSLYRLLTGKTLFQADTVRGILVAHRNEAPPTLADSGLNVPSDLEAIFADLVAKSPDERYAHAQEVVEDLDVLLASSGSRTGFWAALLLIAVGATWGVREYMREDVVVQPEKIVEYVDNENSAETQAKLKAAATEISFRKAMAADSLVARMEGLKEFLALHPDSNFSDSAAEELLRLQDAHGLELAAAAAETATLQESVVAFQALQQSAFDFKTAGRWSEALATLDQSPLAAQAEVLALRETLFQAALVIAYTWKSQHLSLIQSDRWQEAQALEGEWELAFGMESLPWGGTADDLRLLRVETKLAADVKKRFIFRQSLAQSTFSTSRDAVLQFNFVEATGLFEKAQQESLALAPLLKMELEGFRLAGDLVREMAAKAKSGEVRNFQFPGDDRKLRVLDWTQEGLVVQIQSQGTRRSQVLNWSEFHRPTALLGLMDSLGSNPDTAGGKAQLYFLVARGVLASHSSQIEDYPEKIMSQCLTWLNESPKSYLLVDAETVPALAEIKKLEEIARAFRQANDFLSLNRIEDFYSRWSLLAAWCSHGQADFGIRP